MPRIRERVHNIVLFGDTSCGKSSIINLLADRRVADVSTGIEACTRRPQWYPITLGEKKIRLWDTMGFNQPEAKDMKPLSPFEQAHALLQNLQDGVDLILLCARRDRINASFRNLYWLLDSFFFGGRAKIALVLTRFDTPQEGWWDRNRDVIAQRCNIPVQSLPHVCITTVWNGPSAFNPIYNESKQALRALLEEYAVTPTPLRLDLSSDLIGAKIAESLKNQCQLNILEATTLVEVFRSPRRPFHVIVFGDAGAGKSSVINLIVGESVAEVSSDTNTCTLDFRRYTVNTGLHQFSVWDTVGFNGFYNGQTSDELAFENAARLVRDLHGKGGVDLLMFCKRCGRPTPSELSVIGFFREVLCDSKIPVALIITHVERHNPMEKWWEVSGEGFLRACNLETSVVAGHACITSALDDPNDQKLHDKLSLSRQSVLAMLDNSVPYITTYRKEVIRGRNPLWEKKINAKNLMDNYWLTRKQADKLINLLNTQEKLENKPEPPPANVLEPEKKKPNPPPAEAPKPEEENGWWIDERFGRDSSSCISLSILSYHS